MIVFWLQYRGPNVNLKDIYIYQELQNETGIQTLIDLYKQSICTWNITEYYFEIGAWMWFIMSFKVEKRKTLYEHTHVFRLDHRDALLFTLHLILLRIIISKIMIIEQLFNVKNVSSYKKSNNSKYTYELLVRIVELLFILYLTVLGIIITNLKLIE